MPARSDPEEAGRAAPRRPGAAALAATSRCRRCFRPVPKAGNRKTSVVLWRAPGVAAPPRRAARPAARFPAEGAAAAASGGRGGGGTGGAPQLARGPPQGPHLGGWASARGDAILRPARCQASWPAVPRAISRRSNGL